MKQGRSIYDTSDGWDMEVLLTGLVFGDDDGRFFRGRGLIQG